MTKLVTAPWTCKQRKQGPTIDWHVADEQLATAAFEPRDDSLVGASMSQPATVEAKRPAAKRGRRAFAAEAAARAATAEAPAPAPASAPAPAAASAPASAGGLTAKLRALRKIRGPLVAALEQPAPSWLIASAALSACLAMLLLLGQLFGGSARAAEGPARLPSLAGELMVTAAPAGATVVVDGVVRCPTTPCYLGGLALGRELLVAVRAPGHEVWWQRLVLTHSDPDLRLQPRLRPSGSPPPVVGRLSGSVR